MAVIFPFGEGSTDRVVFDFLKSKIFPKTTFQNFVPVNGKDNFRTKIMQTLEGQIIPNNNLCILVFRDVDAGESPEHIVHSFRDVVWDLLDDWNLRPEIQPHRDWPNVHICTQLPSKTTPGLHLILHLADNSALDLPTTLQNHTTDGYVLATGLKEVVMKRFADKIHGNARHLHTLVTNSIPDMIRTNGSYDQDKDYLAAYLCATRFWVIHRTEEQKRLVDIILKRAWKYQPDIIRQVFESWQVAVKEALR